MDLKWYDKDSKAYDIDKMETNHIENCLTLLKKNKNEKTKIAKALETELKTRKKKTKKSKFQLIAKDNDDGTTI